MSRQGSYRSANMDEPIVEQAVVDVVDVADELARQALQCEERADAGGLVLDTLARLPERALLTEAALAKALRVAPSTLRRMVNRWQLPPPVRLGGRRVWLAGRVLAHIEAAAERAARDAERVARKYRGNNP